MRARRAVQGQPDVVNDGSVDQPERAAAVDGSVDHRERAFGAGANFWLHHREEILSSTEIDLSKESAASGMIWLPLELGGFELAEGPFVKVLCLTARTSAVACWCAAQDWLLLVEVLWACL